jgi:hypothetical protein
MEIRMMLSRFSRLTHGGVLVCTAVVVSGVCKAAPAQVIRVDEAEKVKVVCAHKEKGQSLWPSGGEVTPPFWGFRQDESVEWPIQVTGSGKGLKLAVRYSYAAQHHRDFHHAENPRRDLHLIVDGDDKKPIKVHVPDTGWWDIFETSSVDLPELSVGRHVLKIVSPEPLMTTNLDCFILYRGGPDKIPLGLRSTTIARSVAASRPASMPAGRDPTRFVVRVTPKAPPMLKIRPEAIVKQFDRIYDYYAEFMGWTPPRFGVNIIEDSKWPDPGATAFQNNYGVHFRAGVMHTEQGNWCHEMTHMFYVAHFPGWFDESSVHCLTVLHWVPTLFPRGRRPQDDPTYRAWETDARRFLNTPGETTGNMVLIQNAVMVKYGPEVFKRFFHLCGEAGRKKELDFTPGRHLTKAEIIKYMSLAAGEDVGPIYQRWTGLKDVP